MPDIDFFYDYYRQQSIESAQNLFDYIVQSEDFNIIHNADLFNQDIKIKNTDQIDYILSSGTLGNIRKYPVYLRDFWLANLEIFNKNPEHNSLVLLEDSFDYHSGHYLNIKRRLAKIDSFIFNYSLTFDPEQMDWLISQLKSLNTYLILYSNPFVFLKNLRYLKSNLDNFHVVSTNYDAFFKSYGVYVNDCMIDWTTGLNFYTCKYNKKHFLPTFVIKDGYVRNLINLCSEPVPISDYFCITGSSENCDCGRKYIPFTFVPHVKAAIAKNDKYYYDLSLIEYLESEYYSVQFVQEHDNILVLYRGEEMSNSDRSFLTNWWQERGFDVVFLRNKYLVTGLPMKMAVFFNNTITNKPIKDFNVVKRISRLYL